MRGRSAKVESPPMKPPTTRSFRRSHLEKTLPKTMLERIVKTLVMIRSHCMRQPEKSAYWKLLTVMVADGVTVMMKRTMTATMGGMERDGGVRGGASEHSAAEGGRQASKDEGAPPPRAQ